MADRKMSLTGPLSKAARQTSIRAPKVGHKKSRNGCQTCKARRVKYVQTPPAPNFLPPLPPFDFDFPPARSDRRGWQVGVMKRRQNAAFVFVWASSVHMSRRILPNHAPSLRVPNACQDSHLFSLQHNPIRKEVRRPATTNQETKR